MATAQFSGLASGIDSASLIQALVDSRNKTNEIRRADIDFLESENEALDELNTKILALNDLLDKFRTANGGGVSKKSSSSDSSVATAAVSSAANNAAFTVTATSVASTATASYNDAYALTTTAFAANAVGTQTIGVDIGTGADLVSVDVDITSATTVQEYVDAFNANSNASGRAVASIVNVGTTATPSYRVVVASLKEGTELGTIAFDVPTSGAGFGGNSDLQTRTTDQATNAVFSVSGITGTITRSTNAVSDVFSGVTLQMSKVGTADITVSDDADTTGDLFQEIVDGYNDIVEFVAENDQISRTEEGGEIVNTFGSLAKTRLDNEFLARVRLAISEADAPSGTSVTSFSELGISTNRDGTLAFDLDAFKTKLSGDPVGATELFRNFADSAAGISGFLYEYTKFDGFIDVSQEANNTQIESLNDKIEALERNTDTMRRGLEAQFARLETITARFQATQAQLSGILAGLG
ncbi:MAG: flagellar filament capping protein FliD [Deltaproteobacteria bacterium]|nr:flagellar filament capping protein FliD [Deltaproteobacteria bacterium]